jgi:hypothetical protein
MNDLPTHHEQPLQHDLRQRNRDLSVQKVDARRQSHVRLASKRNDGQYEGRTRDLGVISTTL